MEGDHGTIIRRRAAKYGCFPRIKMLLDSEKIEVGVLQESKNCAFLLTTCEFYGLGSLTPSPM